MTLKGRDFFKQQEALDLPPPSPKIPPCIDCFEDANPAWHDGNKVYCRTCAPPEVKTPWKFINKDNQ